MTSIILPAQAFHQKRKNPSSSRISYSYAMKETFSQGSPGMQVRGWYDESDNDEFNAEMEYANKVGTAQISVVDGSPWGKVQSYSLDVALEAQPILEVEVEELHAGTLKINVFSNQHSWEVHECAESISRPGRYTVSIPSVTGWSGSRRLGVELIAEGPKCRVVIRSVGIRSGGLVVNSPQVAWHDPMDSRDAVPNASPGMLPQGWKKLGDVHLQYAAQWGGIIIAGTGKDEPGKAYTGKNITVDLDTYPILQVVIDRVIKGDLQIEIIRGDRYDILDWGIQKEGVYQYNLKECLGWEGIATFGIQLVVGPGQSVVVDDLQIWSGIATFDVQSTVNPAKSATAAEVQIRPIEKYKDKIVIGMETPLSFAVDEKSVAQVMQFIRQQSALPIELRKLSLSDLKLQFHRDEIDVVVSYSVYFYGMYQEGIIEPALVIRKKTKETYQYGLYVSEDSAVSDAHQLRKKRLGCLDKEIAPYLGTLFFNPGRKFDATEYFVEILEYHSPRAAVLALQMGSVDALVGIEHAYDLPESLNDPGIKIHNRMKLLAVSKALPDSPVFVKRSINHRKRTSISEILTGFFQREWKQGISWQTGLEPVEEVSSFDRDKYSKYLEK